MNTNPLTLLLSSVCLTVTLTTCLHQESTSDLQRDGLQAVILVQLIAPDRGPLCTNANFITVSTVAELVRFAPSASVIWWGFADVSVTSGQPVLLDTTTTDLTSFEYPSFRYANAGSDCSAINNYPRGTEAYLKCTGSTTSATCQLFSNSGLTNLAPAGSYLISFPGPYSDLSIHK